MTDRFDIVLRGVRLNHGAGVDFGIRDGRFSAMSSGLGRCDNDIDCDGKLLLPGLHDHHIHLFATAARLQSVDLTQCTHPDAIAAALRAKAAQAGPGEWVRAIGCDERASGIPDRGQIDGWIADRPVRIQDRTGALWMLNSAGLAQLGDGPWPDAVETDPSGVPTGRIWRGDAWLQERIGSRPPSLAALSRELARLGVTAVTDAGANNGPKEAALLGAACRQGDLLQRLTMMGREDLPDSEPYLTGPVKLLYDERDLPDPASIAARIEAARRLGRNVAAHCVTEAELLVYLAVLDMAGGVRPGDRIEHGSMIPQALMQDIARLGLIVVANPGFIARRGDRYLAEMDAGDLPDLQRMASLQASGIPVLIGSDAPYGPVNPWVSIRAAANRQCPSGALLGAEEAIGPWSALQLMTAQGDLAVGAVADCILVDADWVNQLARDADPDPVAMTIMGRYAHLGPIYSRGR
ncbi:MAG: amidohydrolase family protein [Blastomonas sp.]|uniref:amidohydrolase family protein n=1 Tax=Blastomonas sp. TaxID=1909299 RepID=UPI00258E6207|nr:amidohydrolase family protein [Blastomonas sp.]MCO5793849.1 amidohydrolase family protein [Blastomonas sp.]